MERRLWNEVSIYLEPGRLAKLFKFQKSGQLMIELFIMGLNLALLYVLICTVTILPKLHQNVNIIKTRVPANAPAG